MTKPVREVARKWADKDAPSHFAEAQAWDRWIALRDWHNASVDAHAAALDMIEELERLLGASRIASPATQVVSASAATDTASPRGHAGSAASLETEQRQLAEIAYLKERQQHEVAKYVELQGIERALRSEIARLREELEDAKRKIRSLEDATKGR